MAHPYLTCFLAYCLIHATGTVIVHMVDGLRDVLKSKEDTKRTAAMFKKEPVKK